MRVRRELWGLGVGMLWCVKLGTNSGLVRFVSAGSCTRIHNDEHSCECLHTFPRDTS
jgi:hypothetical protein